MNPIIRLATRHPIQSILVLLLLTLPVMLQAPKVQTVDNVDYFHLEDDADALFYEEIQSIFGDDEFFIIAFHHLDIFTPEVLAALRSITEQLEHIEEVRDVQSLANVDFIDGSNQYFEVRPFLDTIPSNPDGLATLRNQALSKPLYVPNLLSADTHTTAIVVFPQKTENDGFRKALLEQTTQILSTYSALLGPYHLAGWSVTNLQLSQSMKTDIATFIPATYLLVTLILWLFFRNIRLILVGLATISACMASTMGLFSLAGIPLNNVTTIVPPLVMALVLADIVHIFAFLNRDILEKLPNRRDALAHVLHRLVVPIFLTSLTTAAGFLSLAVSDIPPIKEFAYLAAAGMGFKFLFSMFLLPPLLLFFEPSRIYSPRTRSMEFLFTKLWRFVFGHHRSILLSVAILLTACLHFGIQIKVETNLLEYFKPSSTLRKDLDFVETRLAGVGTLDISLRADAPDAFMEPRNLQILERVQRYVDDLPPVDATISFVDFLKDMNQAFHDGAPTMHVLPETRELVAQYLLLYGSTDIDDYISASYDHARIAVRISEHGSRDQAELVSSIRRFIQDLNQDYLDIRVTGRAVHNVNTIQALVSGQVTSLFIALVVISLFMFLVLRSVRIGLLSLVPNLFPILLNFGIMGALGIPLNTATALIAVVALGIAVDDTIHFLSAYDHHRRGGKNVPGALERTLLEKGPPMGITSVTLCAGFGVMILSQFVPTIYFGALSAVIMVTALVGDLIILPALLLFVQKWTNSPPLQNGT